MGNIAEKLNSPRGTRSSGDETDEKKVMRRLSSAKNHLRKLAQIAPQLDADDYNSIRDSILPIVETFSKTFEKARRGGESAKTETTSHRAT